MIYPYECECGFKTEVIKSVKECDNLEKCYECDKIMKRVISNKIHFMNEKVEQAEWNPGLGCVVKNKAHKEQIIKERGLIEMGNESIEKMQIENEKTKAEKIEKSWDGIHDFYYNQNKVITANDPIKSS
jgi:hypothetical protein